MLSQKRLFCLGLSHRTAPVEVREQLASALHALDDTMAGSHARFGEMAILTTCNRVEFYAYVSDEHSPDTCNSLLDHIAHFQGCDRPSLEKHLYRFEGREAVRHLCRVAAGLDSLVLGEPQIMGQVNEAIHHALDQKLAGEKLNALFQTALRTGKRARSETAIARNPVSIASMAVYKGRSELGKLKGKRGVVVGVGEMGRLTLKSLQTRGLSSLTLVNRNPEKAQFVAAETGATVQPLTALPEVLKDADIVISATGSPDYIIDKQTVADAVKNRNDTLVLIDIAMPRDIEPGVANLPNVCHFDIDALKTEVESSLREREKEIPHVDRIVEEEVESYSSWLRKETIKPVITDLRHKAEDIRSAELDRLMHLIGPDVDEATREKLRLFSCSLVKKLLHDPTIRLRNEALNGESGKYAGMVRYLFALEEDAQP